jgi:hypothetical protein
MRVTKEALLSRLKTINLVLDRPLYAAVGHLTVDHTDDGYIVVEIMDEAGTTRNWSERGSAHDTNVMLEGIIHGIALRNEYLGRMLFNKRLNETDLAVGTASYSVENAATVHNIQESKDSV